uniref:Uncharacterized protein n=1 Tax=Sphaerodactylus townsendi TaxID=933632 RepID=A0ACB8ED21_9SAUR
MAEQEKEIMALKPSTAEEGVEGDDAEGELRVELSSLQGQLADLTLDRSPYHQGNRFEDPLVKEKAWGKLQRLGQGNCSVSEFTADFRRLASCLRGWPELVLVQLFKDAFFPKVLQWALIHGDPETLMEWIRWAGDAEMQIQQVEQLEHWLNRTQC